MLFSFCGCSESKAEEPKIHTEIQDNLKITYIYDEWGSIVVSKNVYNMDTEVTVEYVYFYENNGWGTQLIGVSVITTTKDGQIVNQFEDRAQ
jgi:hypothetical protein